MATDKKAIKQVSARVPSDKAKALDITARMNDTSVQAVLSDLIDQYLSKYNALPTLTAQSDRLAQSA